MPISRTSALWSAGSTAHIAQRCRRAAPRPPRTLRMLAKKPNLGKACPPEKRTHMNWRGFPAGNDRLLAMALGTSIVLHAVLLAVHFKFPATLRWQASEPRMEVVLVNAKTRERPSKAEVLAQANLDRGGNVDERPPA